MATVRPRSRGGWEVPIGKAGTRRTKTFTYEKDAQAWARKTESEIERRVYQSPSSEDRFVGDLLLRSAKAVVPDQKSINIRLGDSGLQGDTDARNNNVAVARDFRAQSTDGDIAVRNNRIRNAVDNVQIISDGSGDVSVKQNGFRNSEDEQAVEITSQTGDVGVLHNRFGQSVTAVTIESNDGGQCKSKGNRPEVVNTDACLL